MRSSSHASRSATPVPVALILVAISSRVRRCPVRQLRSWRLGTALATRQLATSAAAYATEVERRYLALLRASTPQEVTA